MRGLGWLSLIGLLCSGQAMALCSTVATAPVSFGSVSSINVRTATQNSSTLNGGLSCTASLIALGTNDHFYATITSTTSGMVGPTGM